MRYAEKKPQIAVVMNTYNHRYYIEQAIESVLNQKGSFKIKIFLSDDASNDGTTDICNMYKNKFPESIDLHVAPENTSRRTAKHGFTRALNSDADYIAVCACDDFWTDDNKLEKQLKIFEKNKKISTVIHNQLVNYEHQEVQPYETKNTYKKRRINTYDILHNHPRSIVASLLFRNVKSLPDWFYTSNSGDIALFIWLSTFGDIYYMDDVMATYRRHDSSTTAGWTRLSQNEKIDALKRKIIFYKNVRAFFRGKYSRLLNQNISNRYCEMISVLFAERNWGKLLAGVGAWATSTPRDFIKYVLKK
jgi:glycosyltransferase involved in cell wall biosynthesis